MPGPVLPAQVAAAASRRAAGPASVAAMTSSRQNAFPKRRAGVVSTPL
jgi:hypothetical protein